MERLHALIAFAAFLVSLRGGLNLLKLYGLGKFTSSPAFVPEHCPDFLHPVQPFQQPNGTNLEYDAQQLLQWLKGQAGVVIEGSVGFFGELRGLQAARDVPRHDIILSIPTDLTISIGTFSAAAAAAGSKQLEHLLQLPDGDMYLDVVAILFESLLLGFQQQHPHHQQQQQQQQAAGSRKSKASSERLAAYLLSLPQQVDLPVFLGESNSNSNSNHPYKQLLAALPHLDRLTSKRWRGLVAAWPRAQALLRTLLESASAVAALQRLSACQAWQAFLWAYSIAKTRVVTLGLDEISGEVGRKLSQQLVPLDVEDVGVMVPVLDLANHGTANQVNAHVVGDGTAFRLVAVRDIKEGEQVFISYNPSDEELPACSWRWLLEYGFVPGPVTTAAGDMAALGAIDGVHAGQDARQLRDFRQVRHYSADRHRWCYGMNLTVDVLLNSCNRLSVKDTPVAAKQDEQLVKAIGKQLESMEIEGSFWMELHGTGELPEGLFDWLAAVVGVLWQQKEHVSLQQQQGLSGTDLPDATVISRVDPAQQDVIGQDQSAQHVFCKGCSLCEHGADVFDVDDDNKQQQHSGGSSSSSNGGDNLADGSDRQPIVDCLVSCMLENVLRRQQEVVLQAAQALTVQQPQPQQQQEVTVQYQQQKDACAMDNAGSDMHSTKSCLASGAGGASRWTEGWCHIAADLQRVAWDAFQALDATLHVPQT